MRWVSWAFINKNNSKSISKLLGDLISRAWDLKTPLTHSWNVDIYVRRLGWRLWRFVQIVNEGKGFDTNKRVISRSYQSLSDHSSAVLWPLLIGDLFTNYSLIIIENQLEHWWLLSIAVLLRKALLKRLITVHVTHARLHKMPVAPAVNHNFMVFHERQFQIPMKIFLERFDDKVLWLRLIPLNGWLY